MHLESHSLHRSITQENVQQRSPAPTRTSQVNIARNLSVCLHAYTQAFEHIDWAHSRSLARPLALVSWHNYSLLTSPTHPLLREREPIIAAFHPRTLFFALAQTMRHRRATSTALSTRTHIGMPCRAILKVRQKTATCVLSDPSFMII